MTDILAARIVTADATAPDLVISNRRLAMWAEQPITTTNLDLLVRALEHSTVPEAIGTILLDAEPGDPSRVADAARYFNYEAVREAVNEGADAIGDALDLSDRDTDLINLVVNAALVALTAPGVIDFDTVVTSNYSDTPEEVRDWWDW